jgi:hypothetical protein
MASQMGKAFERTHIQQAEGEAGLAPLRYDYSQIADVEGRTVAQEAAQEVRSLLSHTATLLGRSVENAWRMGGVLTRAKERLEHGEFADWVEAEFGPEQFGDYAIGIRTAQRWMRFYAEVPLVTVQSSKMGLGALLELTAKSTPETVKEEVLRLEASGTKVTKAVIQQLKSRPVVEREPAPAVTMDAPEEQADSYELWRAAHGANIALMVRQVENYRRDALAMGVSVEGYDGAISSLERQRRLLEG